MAYEMIITVDKADLLVKLRENREKHRTVFLAALDGYKKQATEILKSHIRAIEEGRTPLLVISLARPEDHTRDYDRVIGMLEMDKSGEFRLDAVTYGNYVNDDWRWKREWARMSSSYARDSYTSNYGEIEDNGDW
jgi:hypothetical protein